MTSPFQNLNCLGDWNDNDDDFLSALIQNFSARHLDGGGLDVEISLTNQTRLLTSSEEKSALANSLDFDEGGGVIEALEQVRTGERNELSCECQAFGFRHVNGGVLPVIDTGDQIQALLFLRDIHPVGWNIANGAGTGLCDLLDPMAVALREATEELLFWDETEHLAWTVSLQRPDELATALCLLGEDASLLQGSTVPMEILETGPDTLTVHLPDGRSHRTERTHLSFNLADFGLEATWVARVQPLSKFTPRDGELTPEGHLLDRIVGVFDLHELRASLAEEAQPLRSYRSGMIQSTLASAPLCPVTAQILQNLTCQW